MSRRMGFAFLCLLLLGPAPARAFTNPGATLGFQVEPVSPGNVCGFHQVFQTPCRSHETDGGLNAGYTVYIVVGKGALGNPTPGIGGAVFGIAYDGAPGSGIDIFGWNLCADYAFSGNGWPASGGGTVITFDPETRCQRTAVGLDGVHAVLGAFYVYAYSPDELRFTPRSYVPIPDLAVADCAASESPLSPDRTAVARFSAGAAEPGYNPCCVGGGCPPPDGVPPTLVSASGAYASTLVLVRFSEPVDAGADVPANYLVYPAANPAAAIPVVSASVAGSEVTLTLASALGHSVGYVVRVSNVRNLAGVAILPNSETRFSSGGPDIFPPGISSVSGTGGSDVVFVLFNEPVLDGATVVSNYRVAPGPGLDPEYAILGASLSRSQVMLRLDGTLLSDHMYSLTVSNVRDLAGNAIAPGSSFGFIAERADDDSPLVVLHVQPHASANQCTDEAPSALPAAEAVTYASVGGPYDLYIVLVDPVPGATLAGVALGIEYDGAPQSGVDVHGWTNCADLEFRGQGWPASGGGNTITWVSSSNCQSGGPGPGAQAVAGWFYVSAYGEDLFSIVPRSVDSRIRIADCASAESIVPFPLGAGAVGFGREGYNPVAMVPPVRVETTSWGAIKRTYGKPSGSE